MPEYAHHFINAFVSGARERVNDAAQNQPVATADTDPTPASATATTAADHVATIQQQMGVGVTTETKERIHFRAR